MVFLVFFIFEGHTLGVKNVGLMENTCAWTSRLNHCEYPDTNGVGIPGKIVIHRSRFCWWRPLTREMNRKLQRLALTTAPPVFIFILFGSVLPVAEDNPELETRASYESPGDWYGSTEPRGEGDMPFPRFSWDVTNEDLDAMNVVCNLG